MRHKIPHRKNQVMHYEELGLFDCGQSVDVSTGEGNCFYAFCEAFYCSYFSRARLVSKYLEEPRTFCCGIGLKGFLFVNMPWSSLLLPFLIDEKFNGPVYCSFGDCCSIIMSEHCCYACHLIRLHRYIDMKLAEKASAEASLLIPPSQNRMTEP